MKKSVGLITMHRVNNYGSVLQTYATIKLISELGYSCTLIDYIFPDYIHLKDAVGFEDPKNIEQSKGIKNSIKAFLKKIHLFPWIRKIKIDFLIFIYRHKPMEILNNEDFSSFRNKYIAPYITKRIYKRRDILRTPPLFDIYVTGSDQTWNSIYIGSDYSFLLDFAPNDRRKIAFSASFGSSSILPQYAENYRKLLKRYEAISTREASGCKIIRELTGQKSTFVLDPTLLLNKQEWLNLADYSRVPKSKFIFCYIVDYIFSPFPILYQFLRQLNKDSEYKVVIWCDPKYCKDMTEHGYVFLEGMRPEDFLAMYDKADYIVTSSFHGTAFAINFNKDFSVILNPNRSESDSRIAELLSLFGLQSRGANRIDMFDFSSKNRKIDYSKVNLRLTEKRNKSAVFLEKALNGDPEEE